VRTRSRFQTSGLTLAGLGLMAGLVALASDPRATQPVEAAPVADAPAGFTIRDVDFSQAAQPGSTCDDGLADAVPAAITLTRGASDLLDPRSVTRLEVDRAVGYGDLDGDGREEAVVHAVCHYGANGAQDTVQVWTAARGQRRLLDTLTGAPEAVADASAFPPAVVAVAVRGDEVLVTFTSYGDDDPHCCPSKQTEVRYQLDGGDLEPVGRPRTAPAES
jgi:hypothetical protein